MSTKEQKNILKNEKNDKQKPPVLTLVVSSILNTRTLF